MAEYSNFDLKKFLAENKNTEAKEVQKEELDLTAEENIEELDGAGSVDALTALIGAGGLAGGAVALNKLMDALEAGKLGSKGEAVAKFLRSAGKTFSGAGLKEEETTVELTKEEAFKKQIRDILLSENKPTNSRMVSEDAIKVDLNELGPEFEQTLKEIFGDPVSIDHINAQYRPSTDTGTKPTLSLYLAIRKTNENPKAIFLAIFFDKDGGRVQYRNDSTDKEGTEQEFNNKLFPAFKKAASSYLGKFVKNPQALTKSTVGYGYEYEEKDQADLDKYVSEIPNVPAKKL